MKGKAPAFFWISANVVRDVLSLSWYVMSAFLKMVVLASSGRALPSAEVAIRTSTP